ncbi:hypothetical protein [Quatrionicoccus australiensis]|uniref:hypothetical protein n=1 Tax=Quatrionicoccus australiensis TaxID=138118 RepID=UPI001CFC4377|nr:hypothetical protein [Quatrionicoccus australiensis]MCB4358580.1 hypothetical protein [Quatrionicoccus australiensis]
MNLTLQKNAMGSTTLSHGAFKQEKSACIFPWRAQTNHGQQNKPAKGAGKIPEPAPKKQRKEIAPSQA